MAKSRKRILQGRKGWTVAQGILSTTKRTCAACGATFTPTGWRSLYCPNCKRGARKDS
jgi:hypothetical protein